MTQAYAQKYQEQNLNLPNNVASIALALCEKAIKCIYTAIEAHKNNDRETWSKNLGTVSEVIKILVAAISTDKTTEDLKKLEEFYRTLSLYTKGLIIEQIEPSKAQDLLESFRIIRDTWKSIEKQYLELQYKDSTLDSDGSI